MKKAMERTYLVNIADLCFTTDHYEDKICFPGLKAMSQHTMCSVYLYACIKRDKKRDQTSDCN